MPDGRAVAANKGEVARGSNQPYLEGTPGKSDAQAVIIGGGVYGASIAYHLTKMGWRDVVLVEKGGLTGGATFHAAGLVGQLRGSVTLTRMIMYSVELYRTLLAGTGHDPDWRETGSMGLAPAPGRRTPLEAPGPPPASAC